MSCEISFLRGRVSMTAAAAAVTVSVLVVQQMKLQDGSDHKTSCPRGL